MNLPRDKIEEFQVLYRKHYGYELPYEQAEIEAKKLIELVAFIHKNSSFNYQQKL